MTDYAQLSHCQRTDVLELAALRGQTLQLTWREGTEQRQDAIRVSDLVTTQGHDWLVGTTADGADWRVAVDQITAVGEFQR
ncbi:MAG TPA: hypothetical protein VIS52_06535 [Motiliproteus sp.]